MFNNAAQQTGGDPMNCNGIAIHPHARTRWRERTRAGVSLRRAWQQAWTVSAPAADADFTRLFPPYDLLLIYRGGMLRTVMHNDGRIDAPRLVECPACDTVNDPFETRTCRWCTCNADLETTCGAFDIKQEGDQ
jgi:hypothetical protein